MKAQWLKEFTGKENLVIVDKRNVVEPDDFIEKSFVYKGYEEGIRMSMKSFEYGTTI